MEVDPAASMRCWPITLELAGREYEIPALPAADWWPVLLAGDPTRVLDLIPSRLGGPEDLDELLLSGQIAAGDLGTAVLDAIEAATGRSFHVSFVLVTVAANGWLAIGGALAQTGFRWDIQPIGAALDAIYALAVGLLEDEPRAKFLRLLEDERLTTGERKVDREKALSEFETMAGPRPAPAPVPGRSTGAPSGSARPRTPRQPRPPRPAVQSS